METYSKSSIVNNDSIHSIDNYRAELEQLVEAGRYKCMEYI